jgi:hypothetical protein
MKNVMRSLFYEQRERETEEQSCQKTETTSSIHFRTLYRSVGSSGDFFLLLSPVSMRKVQKRGKKMK